MPQLPSGRHVAIQATPLFAVMEAALRGDTLITHLLRIDRIEHLRPYVDVIYFLELDGTEVAAVAPGGQPVPESLQPYLSGFTLATIEAELATWPQRDRTVFEDYLASEPAQKYFAALLGEVIKTRERLELANDASLPSAFASLAALVKYVAVQKISPDFYEKHWQSIEFASALVRQFAHAHPALEPAFRTALPVPIAQGARAIEAALSGVQFSEDDLRWFDTQMNEALRVLVPVVRETDLPAWLIETKWAIEGAFEAN